MPHQKILSRLLNKVLFKSKTYKYSLIISFGIFLVLQNSLGVLSRGISIDNEMSPEELKESVKINNISEIASDFLRIEKFEKFTDILNKFQKEIKTKIICSMSNRISMQTSDEFLEEGRLPEWKISKKILLKFANFKLDWYYKNNEKIDNFCNFINGNFLDDIPDLFLDSEFFNLAINISRKSYEKSYENRFENYFKIKIAERMAKNGDIDQAIQLVQNKPRGSTADGFGVYKTLIKKTIENNIINSENFEKYIEIGKYLSRYDEEYLTNFILDRILESNKIDLLFSLTEGKKNIFKIDRGYKQEYAYKAAKQLMSKGKMPRAFGIINKYVYLENANKKNVYDKKDYEKTVIRLLDEVSFQLFNSGNYSDSYNVLKVMSERVEKASRIQKPSTLAIWFAHIGNLEKAFEMTIPDIGYDDEIGTQNVLLENIFQEFLNSRNLEKAYQVSLLQPLKYGNSDLRTLYRYKSLSLLGAEYAKINQIDKSLSMLSLIDESIFINPCRTNCSFNKAAYTYSYAIADIQSYKAFVLDVVVTQLIKLGKFKKALTIIELFPKGKDYEYGLIDRPSKVRSLISVAIAYYKNGQTQRAIQIVQRLLDYSYAKDTSSVQGYSDLSVLKVLTAAGAGDLAESFVDKIMDPFKVSDSARRTMARLAIVDQYIKNQHPDKANVLLDKALENILQQS